MAPSGAGTRWAVVGGGFRGIVAAKLLREAGCEVTLVERAPALGGVLHAEEWRGLFLDKGCHYFDNRDAGLTSIILEILDGRVHPLAPALATRLDARMGQGVALVDFSAQDPGLQQRICGELREAASTPETATGSLKAAIEARFGPTAGAAVSAAAGKAFCIDPGALEAEALWTSPFVRIRPADDAATASLKRASELDGRLAVGSLEDPFRFAPEGEGAGARFFYPAGRGLRGFCDAAEAHLRGLGVGLRLGTGLAGLCVDAGGARLQPDAGAEILADRVFWALDPGPLAKLLFGEDPLAALVHRTPMVLYHFLLPAAAAPAFTYYYDFDPGSLVYRASAPGFYGRQTSPEGLSYVCAEVIVPQGSEVWQDPAGAAQSVWEELRTAGFTDLAAPVDCKILQTPVSFKNPKLGHAAALAETTARIAAVAGERVIFSDPALMKKNDILREVAALVGPAADRQSRAAG